MDVLIKAWTLYLASGIEAASAVVIGVAAAEAILRANALFFRRDRSLAPDEKEAIRLRLGRWLALAGIVGLRTALNHFLHQEIDREAIQHPGKKLDQLQSGVLPLATSISGEIRGGALNAL